MLQRIGRYEILDRIAAGGQGTVYRARDTVLDRVVAVKIINQPVTDEPEYLEALQREARLASSLDHPNITRVMERCSNRIERRSDNQLKSIEQPDGQFRKVSFAPRPATSMTDPVF